MSTQVMLTLPDEVYRRAQRLANSAQRPVPGLLNDVLTQAISAWDMQEQSVQSLTDDLVLARCDSQMAAEQSERLGELLDRQQTGTLKPNERPELWALMRVYEYGQLQKAEALVEAVNRGLCPAGRP